MNPLEMFNFLQSLRARYQAYQQDRSQPLPSTSEITAGKAIYEYLAKEAAAGNLPSNISLDGLGLAGQDVGQMAAVPEMEVAASPLAPKPYLTPSVPDGVQPIPPAEYMGPQEFAVGGPEAADAAMFTAGGAPYDAVGNAIVPMAAAPAWEAGAIGAPSDVALAEWGLESATPAAAEASSSILGDYVIPGVATVAGTYGMYKTMTGDYGNTGKDYMNAGLSGAMSGAAMGSFGGLPGMAIGGAIGGIMGLGKVAFGGQKSTDMEDRKIKAMVEAGIISPDDPRVGQPDETRSRAEQLADSEKQYNLGADYRGLTPDGTGWVNNKWLASGNEADLTGFDVQGYASLDAMFGPEYQKRSMLEKAAMAQKLLDEGLIDEHHGTMDITGAPVDQAWYKNIMEGKADQAQLASYIKERTGLDWPPKAPTMATAAGATPKAPAPIPPDSPIAEAVREAADDGQTAAVGALAPWTGQGPKLKPRDQWAPGTEIDPGFYPGNYETPMGAENFQSPWTNDKVYRGQMSEWLSSLLGSQTGGAAGTALGTLGSSSSGAAPSDSPYRGQSIDDLLKSGAIRRGSAKAGGYVDNKTNQWFSA